MFDQEWVDGLDAGGACAAIGAAHRDLVEVECRQLLLAAQWLDLHAPVEEPDAPVSQVPPGRERWVRAGAEGTPQISEFGCAEFAALQEMHPRAGAVLLGKVANLRHRHPLLWARVRDGEVRGWKALEGVRITAKTTVVPSGRTVSKAGKMEKLFLSLS
jgi:hypothetical protein